MLVPDYLTKLIKGYRDALEPVHEKYDLSKIELDILLFLANQPDYDTASDIIKRRFLTKSHVSTAVNTLYEKGFIEKEHRNQNKKTVHLVLRPKSKEIISEGREAQKHFFSSLTEGLSEEETDMLEIIARKMMHNLNEILEEE